MTNQLRLSITWFLSIVVILLTTQVASAQDPFEIQVYMYQTVPKGMYNLETHINYVARGTKTFEGTVAPTDNQFHFILFGGK